MFTDNLVVAAAAPIIAWLLVMGTVIGVHQWYIRIWRPRRRSLRQLNKPLSIVRMSEAVGVLRVVDRLEHSPNDDDQRWATTHLITVHTWLFGERHNGFWPARVRRARLLEQVEARLATRGVDISGHGLTGRFADL